MAVYAIGDIQGCFDDLQRLLAHIRFDPGTDHLWFVGDLVNRGLQSLATLRFVRDLGERAVTVLGNHDLHLIAAAHDHPLDHSDHTLDDILTAPDRAGLIEWLCRRPLLHHDTALGFTMVHAGLPPQWDLAQAQTCAREVEQVLHGTQRSAFIGQMYGNKPNHWSPRLQGWDRLRFSVNCFTRMRYCDTTGKLDLKSKGPPGTQPQGQLPWFEVPGRASRKLNIVFGHWSSLGAFSAPGVYATDTGCLWGGRLSALRLDDPVQRFSVPCAGQRKPGRN
jgi:bis(5'-nucleosyl)-tetraphosphatase (symmetrical)